MAIVACTHCGYQRDIIMRNLNTLQPTDDVLRGALTCKCERKGKPCNGTTVFELTKDGITFYPGLLFEEDLRGGVAPNAKEMMMEAIKCFYGASNRGVVAFCRSAAEEALSAKEVPGSVLDDKIKRAGEYLTADEQVLAHSARLIGRLALHHMAIVSNAAALGALNNTIEFINAVEKKESFPEWQLKRGSIATKPS